VRIGKPRSPHRARRVHGPAAAFAGYKNGAAAHLSLFFPSFLFTQANNTLLATLGFWMRLAFGPSVWPLFSTRLTCIGHAAAEIRASSRIPPRSPPLVSMLRTLCDANHLVRLLRSASYWPRIRAEPAPSALDLRICLVTTSSLIYYTRKTSTTEMPRALGIAYVTAHS
jgi:hypothetical protein